MKKHWKTLIFAAAATAVLACGTSAFAVSDVHATIYEDPVFVEGQEVYCWSPSGKETDYLSYNGTTYIPIRTAGEWMGKNVSWDAETKTIELNGATEQVFREQGKQDLVGQARQTALQNGITVQLRDDIQVIVDGVTQHFKNANGAPVYPINYNDMNYLPVRNIGELLGMSVSYLPQTDRSPSSIFLRTPLTDAQVQEGLQYIQTLQALESYQNPANSLPTPLVSKFDARVNSTNTQSLHTSKSMFQNFAAVWDTTTLEECKAFTAAALSAIQQMIDTPCPDLPVLQTSHTEFVEKATESLTQFKAVQSAIDAGSDGKAVASMLGQNDSACTAFDRAGAIINEMYTVLTESYATMS